MADFVYSLDDAAATNPKTCGAKGATLARLRRRGFPVPDGVVLAAPVYRRVAAGAVVTAVGGRLTHGSLVAREYGIPAVVAVEDAVSKLRTGDRVRVDGDWGIVVRLAVDGDRAGGRKRETESG